MTNWRYKIEISKVLDDVADKFDLSRLEEECPDELKEALALEVAKAFPLARFASKFRKAKTIAEVNRILENVYNAADDHKVWCGL